VLREERDGIQFQNVYRYGPNGERLSQHTIRQDGGPSGEFFHSYNTHGDVEAITDRSGQVAATYGYTAYGQDDPFMFTGVDKPDPANPTKQPVNPYRFNAKPWDHISGTYDMGFRDYSPTASRFLNPDVYQGSMADLGLGTNPATANRYAFARGNPINRIEINGHYDGWDAIKDVGGFFKGFGEQAWETGVGLWDFATGFAECAYYGTCADPLIAVGSYAWNHPGDFFSGMWHSTWDPIAEDWKAGNEGEAIGRGVFGVAELLLGTKGLTKLTKLGRLPTGGAPTPKPTPKSIALGLDRDPAGNDLLQPFADARGAFTNAQWAREGLVDLVYDDAGVVRGPSFDIRFAQATSRSINSGGRILFNLDYVSIGRALRADTSAGPYGPGGFTNWELQQVLRDPQLYNATDWFIGGGKLTPEDVLGFELGPWYP
jgi:RHS repeat-associated protein